MVVTEADGMHVMPDGTRFDSLGALAQHYRRHLLPVASPFRLGFGFDGLHGRLIRGRTMADGLLVEV